jgi:serine/threonine protein kinase
MVLFLIPVIYLLGTGNSPPVPKDLQEKATEFLKLCFTIDPEKRLTALELLTNDFTDVHDETIDFTTWAKNAMMNRNAANSDNGEESSEDSDDETDTEDTEDEIDTNDADTQEITTIEAHANNAFKSEVHTSDGRRNDSDEHSPNEHLQPPASEHGRQSSSTSSVHIEDFGSSADLQYMLNNPELLDFE